MSKYTKKVIISYDSDEAGQRAANRAMQILSEVGLDVRVLHMTGAKDPDEFIKKFGADRFRQVLGESKTGFEFKLENVLAAHDIGIATEKIKASEEICDIIAGVYSGVEREVYIARASERLGLSKESIKNDVDRLRSRKERDRKKAESREAMNSAKNYGDRLNNDAVKNVQANSAEETILGLLMNYDEHRSAVESGKIGLSREDFFTALGTKMFDAIMEIHKSDGGFNQSLLGEKLTHEEMGRLMKFSIIRREMTQNGLDVLESAVDTLKKEKEREKEKENGDIFASLRRKQKQAADKKKTER